ncbi:MAG: class I SAM-dependent methyltransferase [Acidobacteriota bacterium]|nr:class I SAM-dependent methyltransferase [Acidobacteriota bacterium]
MTKAEQTPWAAKAAALYDAAYADRYRSHDDSLADSGPYLGFVAWLQRVCARFTSPVDALEIGCGTGRYFSALQNVRTLVGLDASPAMLALAAHPFREAAITVERVTLLEGDALAHDFPANSFDLVYSIGVLAEHVPQQAELVGRVHSWLRRGGRFAFSTVHPASPSVPQTAARRLGSALMPWVPGRLHAYLRDRYLAGGLYADETYLRGLLADGFEIESIERFVSEAHLHCLCVARRVTR